MDKREAYYNLQKKIAGYTETAYFDSKSVTEMIGKFERFVNNMSNDHEVMAAAAEFANDDMANELMEERGITFPKDAEDAQTRRLDVVGQGVANLHRTLNQSFGRMVETYIMLNAAAYEAGIYDARNEAICRHCHIMWEALCDADEIHGLPFI